MALAAAQSVRAQLIAYEGFNYAAGSSIAGQSGGDSFGWAGTWATGSGNVFGTNVAGNLGYTDLSGNTLATDGGSMIVSSYTLTTAATPNRTLGSFVNGPNTYSSLSNGTYWISFLAQRIGPSNSTQPYYDRQANMALFQTTSERLDVGRPNTNSFVGTPYDTWSLWHNNGTANNGTTFARPTSYPLNSPSGASFLLLRIDSDNTTGNDTAYMWVNWTNLTIEPDLSTALVTNSGFVNLSGVNNFRFQANGASGALTNAFLQVDELRVGLTFADVAPVPEPSAIALVALTGAALAGLARARKRTRA